MSVNKVILIGNLGADPEVKHLENNNAVANFNIATSETYKDKEGNKVTNTEWHRIVVWNGLAKVAEQWLKKGSQIYVEGKITTRKWEDKEGNERYTTEILCSNFTMLGSAKSTVTENGSQNTNLEDNPDDDLPF